MTAAETVVLRADGSARVGLGHIGRTLALAAGLRAAGFEPRFVTRAEDPRVLALITAAGFTRAPRAVGPDWPADAEATRAEIRHAGARAVVVDLSTDGAGRAPEAYAQYLARLKDTGAVLVVFDDLDRLPGGADIVVNPNVGAREGPAGGAATVRLSGPRYFPCPPRLAGIGRRRQIRSGASRVLVTLGGGDPRGLAARVVGALGAVSAPDPLWVTVLRGLGGGGPSPDGGDGGRMRIDLVESVVELAEHLEWADVAITAGGLTKYEAAAAGVPALVLAQVEHQEAIARRFAHEGSARYLGAGEAVSGGEIAAAVAALLADAPLRSRMSEAGRRLVDGHGAARIVERMQALVGALR